VFFLVGGLLVGGPIGAVIGLLLSIAITLSIAKNNKGQVPMISPGSVFAAIALLVIGGAIWAFGAVGQAVHDAGHPAEAAQRQAEEKRADEEVAAKEVEATAKAERKRKAIGDCMGEGAIDLPPAAFREMDRLCRQSTANAE
jgi:hypothetical protein